MVGVLWAAAAVLGLAGLAKLRHPEAAAAAVTAARLPWRPMLGTTIAMRSVGAAELAVALAVLGLGGRWPALLLAAGYASLTVVAVRITRQAPTQPCGCLGNATQPISRGHLAVDIAGLTVGLTATVVPQPSLPALLTAAPGATAAVVIAAALLTWLALLAMTALPELTRVRRTVENPG